ncbi:MAG: CAP domain-containing protein [Burkholderiaceae bacterium]
MTSSRQPNRKASTWLVSLLIAALAAGCGGGGGGGGDTSSSGRTSNLQPDGVVSDGGVPVSILDEAGAPRQTGDMATDGFNWLNFRRQQMGLAPVTRNALVDKAALAHSNYQAVNDFITHDEVSTRRGFTGTSVFERLQSAGYSLPGSNYAFGEVISATGDKSGVNAAEELITAIYHRFVIMEPKFLEAGAGTATGSSGYTYFTTNFATRALNQGGLRNGGLVTYPFNGQQNLPTVFYSDQEQPDPVPDRNEVGYPVSVHADITATLKVDSFTISPRGRAPLSTLMLTADNDKEIGRPSVAAIIPLDVLQSQTDYDVRFVGTVDDVAVNRSWSFRTR